MRVTHQRLKLKGLGPDIYHFFHGEVFPSSRIIIDDVVRYECKEAPAEIWSKGDAHYTNVFQAYLPDDDFSKPVQYKQWIRSDHRPNQRAFWQDWTPCPRSDLCRQFNFGCNKCAIMKYMNDSMDRQYPKEKSKPQAWSLW